MTWKVEIISVATGDTLWHTRSDLREGAIDLLRQWMYDNPVMSYFEVYIYNLG